MQFAANSFVNDFAKSALIGGVDILVSVLCLKRAGSPFLGYDFEASFNLGELQCRENAGFLICSGEGNTSINVLAPETGVIGKGLVVLHK